MNIIHGKKTSIETIQEYAKALEGKLLSNEYRNALCKLDWECSLGHRFSTTFNHVKNRNQWCPVCGKDKSHKSLIIRMANPEIREKISKSHLKRLNSNGFFCGKTHRHIASEIRDNLTGLFRNPSKHKRILKYIGCSLEELTAHLESKFQEGMTWENRGQFGWHIDHVVPLSSFDLSIEENLYKSNNYKNLQPLWAKDNLVKSNKIIKGDLK